LRWGRVISRGALELAHTVAYRAAELREFARPEHDQNDNQDNDQMDGLECAHASPTIGVRWRQRKEDTAEPLAVEPRSLELQHVHG
jgi:hypothetical protein